MDSLVSTDWLAQHLGEEGVTIVDSTWFMPASGRSGRSEFIERHIPGARFLDIDEVSDHSNSAPHMLPTTDQFGEAMERLGIGREDRIVVYDNSPIRTAARGWFSLRHFGAPDVSILDGGFEKWLSEGRPIQSGEPAPREALFVAEEQVPIVTKEQLLAGLGLPWVDARGKGRFEGSESDPRPGVASGHAPGAFNLPFGMLYRDDGRFRSVDELRSAFEASGIDPTGPFVASCGSGVTAASLLFAAHLLGNDDTRLYDGSWSEWGADPSTPKLLGPA
jgi:thiosulfate/3-mercaptopyruvate sulfurtransferase